MKLKIDIETLKKLASQGDVEAMYELGKMHMSGNEREVEMDLEQAHTLFQKAADMGHIEAMYELGVLEVTTTLFAKDLDKCPVNSFIKLPDFPTFNDDLTKQERAQLLNDFRDNIQVEKFQVKLIEGTTIEEILQKEKIGVEKIIKLAEQGHVKAICFLGKYYSDDASMSKDIQLAAHNYELAASLGDTEALFLLGRMYIDAKDGFTKDINKGLSLIKSASDKEYKGAQYWLAKMHYEGKFVEKDYNATFMLARKAAYQGDPAAQFLLAACYQKGQGTMVDRGASIHWLSQSATLGYEPAMKLLVELIKLGKIKGTFIKLPNGEIHLSLQLF
ncbi:MAG: SEL1-like repeat protein [Clostridiales Family XIII bacterium]|jgi:TPR repeat protein|nr:SEL1-like repeat protein [Clostridiales Family XIII bacterium]